MSDWLHQAYLNEAGWGHLRALCNLENRLPGTRGEATAAQLTTEALDRAGVRDVLTESFEVQGWRRGSSVLEHDESGRTFDCISLPRSPSADAAGELRVLGRAGVRDFQEADLDGAMVMVDEGAPPDADRAVHRQEKYRRTVEQGGAAFLFRSDTEGDLPRTGTVGTNSVTIGEIPAVGVSREVGLGLARQFAGDRIHVSVEAESPQSTSQNVHGKLGPDTDREVVVVAHLDAHDVGEGAIDNGSGVGMLVALARTLADREEELDTAVRLLAVGAEEVGFRGSEEFADSIDPDSIKAVVNVDAVAFGELQILPHRSDALEGIAERVADRFDLPVGVDTAHQPYSDHWSFLKRGIPAVALTCTPANGRGWGHTSADTLDKLDRRTFADQAIFTTELVTKLTANDVTVDPFSPPDLAKQLEQDGVAEGLRAIGDFPFDEL